MTLKTILITGATDGIGKATAEMLANEGHEIIIHGRSAEKGKRVCREIQEKTGNDRVEFVTADFQKLSDLKLLTEDLFKRFKKIDILINNAGVFIGQKNILPNGLEETFMVNHLAPFYMTLELLPLIKKSNAARIINVSSIAHASSIDFDNLQSEKNYNGAEAYALSKLGNLLFTHKLANDLENFPITVNAMHPGVINTKLLIAGWGPVGEAIEPAAKRLYYLTLNEELASVSGKYFINNKQTPPAEISLRPEIMDKLWDISLKLIDNINKN